MSKARTSLPPSEGSGPAPVREDEDSGSAQVRSLSLFLSYTVFILFTGQGARVDIRKLQNTTHNLIPFVAFSRVVSVRQPLTSYF